MDAFYAQTSDYSAFAAPVDHSDYFAAIEPLVAELIASRGQIHVLELGAGKPTFPSCFARLRDRMVYHVQDVTPQNAEYLKSVADHVVIGDISQVQGTFDLIFSTFVFEHVATPCEFLEAVSQRLKPGGAHVVICPRYDMPGYIPPSLRHLPFVQRTATHAFLLASRILSCAYGEPRFWVNCDPAMFHTQWFRDSDAIHLVSQLDVVRWHRQNGFSVSRIAVRSSGFRQWLLKRCLTVAIICRKQET